ncbi:MAG: DUF6178 family protein [Vicinamibacterales bacterium]
MSKITNRDTASRDGDSVEHRLARLLDTPFLARVVPHLPAETLHQLIRSCGLDACSELVTSATPAQLTALLDLDLWHPARPGRDEQFDVDRFGEWIEVLVDTGHSVAARTVAALERNVVVAGLSRYVRVFDPGIFEPTAQSDDEPTDRHEAMREGDRDAPVHDSSDDVLECEVGGYLVRARRTDAWDAIVTLLVTLGTEHNHHLHAVMQGCRSLSNSRPEIDGLDDLLLAPEQHLHDVTIERERRRSQQGYATPADARAFLEMARQPKHTRSGAPITRLTGSINVNPIVTAYFRAADEAPESSNETARSPERELEPPSSTSPSPSMSLPSGASRSSEVHAHATDVPESLEAVMELLTEAGVMPKRPRALLEVADADPRAARLAHLRPLIAYVRDTHETAYFTRSRELAFLANTLLAGCSVQSRPFTPQEASDGAAAICNLGLEYWPARWPSVTSPGASDTFPPDSLLIDHDLVTAFEVGWSVLHQEVSLFVAEQLIATLTDIDCVDRDIRRGLNALRRTLVKQRDAGTPWRARDAAEVLAMLDMTAWISVLGLLDECPVVPAALTAVLEGRTTTVSPTEFDFISTAAQIGDVRIFMRKLPDVLSR